MEGIYMCHMVTEEHDLVTTKKDILSKTPILVTQRTANVHPVRTYLNQFEIQCTRLHTGGGDRTRGHEDNVQLRLLT